MIEAYALYSGSSGNAYLLRCGKTSVLVDAGRSAAALCRSLRAAGVEPESVSAVLVTHEHRDHVSALRVFSGKYHTPIIGAAPVLAAVCENDGMRSAAKALVPGREFSIGEIAVCGCAAPHDSSANMCYRFRSAGGESFAVATDMGEVTNECEEFLMGVTCAVIEANHDSEMLRLGPYPPGLKARIASRYGHLSNTQCASLAAGLAASGTGGFVLAHLSRENNTSEMALRAVGDALEKAGFGGCGLVCAGEDHAVRIVIQNGSCELCEIQ